MSTRREVKLPSGAVLKIQVAPFAVSKSLYQAMLKEMKPLKIDSDMQLHQLFKDLFCAGFTSPEIDRCLGECFKSCTYAIGQGELKLTEEILEPVERRADYLTICIEVVKDNVAPFTRSLYADYKRMSAELLSTLEKNQE